MRLELTGVVNNSGRDLRPISKCNHQSLTVLVGPMFQSHSFWWHMQVYRILFPVLAVGFIKHFTMEKKSEIPPTLLLRDLKRWEVPVSPCAYLHLYLRPGKMIQSKLGRGFRGRFLGTSIRLVGGRGKSNGPSGYPFWTSWTLLNLIYPSTVLIRLDLMGKLSTAASLGIINWLVLFRWSGWWDWQHF